MPLRLGAVHVMVSCDFSPNLSSQMCRFTNMLAIGELFSPDGMSNQPEVGGGGVLYQIVDGWVQHAMKTWTQSDLRLCQNDRSKRPKITKKKRGSFGLKFKEKKL